MHVTEQKKKMNFKELIISIAIPLLVGGLSALLTRDAMQEFDQITKPPLAPPAWLFPVVWTILYILMGMASYLIYQKKESNTAVPSALRLYGAQLIVNFFWSIIFFNLRLYFPAFIWLIILWALILLTISAFCRIDKRAVYLMLPYSVWVTFAGYLNLGIAILN